MYMVSIINTETGDTLDTLFSEQYGSLSKTLDAAKLAAEQYSVPCRIDYRIMGCL